MRLRFENGGLRANDASVVAADIEAANGLVHVIDGVLIPEDLEVRGADELLVGIVPGDVSGRILRGLNVRRNLAAIGIDDVLAGGGAEAAGLQPGDVIVSVNGAAATRERLDEAKREAGPGGTVELEIVRRVRVRVLREGERVDDH